MEREIFLLNTIKQIIQRQLPSRLKHRFETKQKHDFSKVSKSYQVKKKKKKSFLMIQLSLAEILGHALNLLLYFQVSVFWKVAERHTEPLCMAPLISM